MSRCQPGGVSEDESAGRRQRGRVIKEGPMRRGQRGEGFSEEKVGEFGKINCRHLRVLSWAGREAQAGESEHSHTHGEGHVSSGPEVA